MNEFFATGGGTSSLELSRTSKGEYNWSVKLYFIGNEMRIIKHMIENIIKTRSILEAILGQKLIPNEEMTAYEKGLQESAEEAAKEAIAKSKEKAKD